MFVIFAQFFGQICSAEEIGGLTKALQFAPFLVGAFLHEIKLASELVVVGAEGRLFGNVIQFRIRVVDVGSIGQVGYDEGRVGMRRSELIGENIFGHRLIEGVRHDPGGVLLQSSHDVLPPEAIDEPQGIGLVPSSPLDR